MTPAPFLFGTNRFELRVDGIDDERLGWPGRGQSSGRGEVRTAHPGSIDPVAAGVRRFENKDSG